MNMLESLSGFLWGPWTPWALLAAGVLFTVWTRFVQYTAMTHGVAIIRGQYDDPEDPGAINHFQALSAALSATVGLGNIGGVALAIGAGGPGALFWMWVVGLFGMALKSVEITLAMQYRNTDDPDNPHGGAMWVVDRVIGDRAGYHVLGKVIGVFFCLTLLTSTITGGNMFQAWSVAELTEKYFGVARVASGIVIAVVVGLVILGGIKRIGQVAAKLVPLMCAIYLLSALAVLAMHVADLPRLLTMVVTQAFAPTQSGGAFIGGTMGFAFMKGMQRALFSNEAGQGSAPIAHAAAKTHEPAREGIVGGLGPFIDTICICTLTALVILSTGTWNRDPLTHLENPRVTAVQAFEDSPVHLSSPLAAGTDVFLKVTPQGDPRSARRLTGTLQQEADGAWRVRWDTYTSDAPPQPAGLEVFAVPPGGDEPRLIGEVDAFPAAHRAVDDGGTPDLSDDDLPLWGLLTSTRTIDITSENEYLWENIDDVFTVVLADENGETGDVRHKLKGRATLHHDDRLEIAWGVVASGKPPVLVAGTGLFRDYTGAVLTGHAFDRAFPGLGKWLVTLAAWLFAVSTMISWSYYGEQGVIYMLGDRFVLPYKAVFLAGAIYAAAGITNTHDMEVLMDLGTGAMLWANIPIVVGLGFLSVRCLNDYVRRLKAGEFIKRNDAGIRRDS